MNVRLVAYRPATTTATSDSTYQLDLQEAPNIALNFQFSDIKEPDTRKSSYSQTFKLPFTDKNHQFFQDWYNVNISTLVFNTRTKFNATLYVGTVPQFEGSLQLKGVYQKAGVYEVVLMSNTADLFSVIGEKKLRDTLKNDDGSYSAELNHEFNETQMLNSWNGVSSAFVNVAGASLRDTTVNVQKVMYPMAVTQPEFYWDEGSNQFLDMTQADIGDDTIYPEGVVDAFPYMVSLLQFRPAIQIKTLLKLIIARAGFSYTSTFIDGVYFGKIFMTTGNHLGESTLPTVDGNDIPGGTMNVGSSGIWGQYGDIPLTCEDYDPVVVPANEEDSDPDNSWNSTYDYFTKTHPTQTQIQVKHKVDLNDIVNCESDQEKVFDVWLQGYDTDNNQLTDTIYDEIIGLELSDGKKTHYLDITNLPINYSCQILMRPRSLKKEGGALSGVVTLGTSSNYGPDDDWRSKITIIWTPYSTGIYDSEINMPMCIDPDITQKAFLKDIIQRFNLVILSDPDDSTNLLIEPYNDYLADNTIKDWTKKLDLSKEVVVRDTTSLQKKSVKFTDLEDVDMANKVFKEEQPNLNVWGKVDVEVTNNQFATGDLKNDPICSPYINERIYRGEETDIPSYPVNMVVQYEHSYKKEEDIYIPITSAETKPKLFWYNGTATTVRDSDGNQLTYNLHYQPVVGQAITAVTFTTYPVCTPYDITPSSDAYTLGPTNKSLYWWSNPPIAGESTIFNYDADNGTWGANTLYGLYWKPYLDNIYSTDARIMECHLNINEVDVFNFKFNDEIYIKDTYWRILNISNYQVGAKASTKVTLLKVVDALNNCSDCSYVVGYINGSNMWQNQWYLWCPEGTPGCTPDTTGAGFVTDASCCECIPGGEVLEQGLDGDVVWCYDGGSLPLIVQEQSSLRSILGGGTLKSIISDKIGGLNRPLVRGVDNTRYSRGIMPNYGDDIVIKYKTKRTGIPQLQGESHRFVLTGYTEGDTRSYAYPEGTLNSKPLIIPTNTNTIIRVKGIATVIGGSSSTYTIGTTEGFAYYTAFKNGVDGSTQLSTVGGQEEFSIREGANPTTCTLHIDMNNSLLRFGLDDSQTDTKRIWALTIDLDVNNVHNFALGYGENWALFQNGQNIELQNGDFLIWN